MERMKYIGEREREEKILTRQGSLRWKIEGWESKQGRENESKKREEVASRCQGDNSVLEIFPNLSLIHI